jgi:hypothetical protein
VTGERAPLGAERLLRHLYDDVLSLFQQIFDLRLGRTRLGVFAFAAAFASSPSAIGAATGGGRHGSLDGRFHRVIVFAVQVVEIVEVVDDVRDVEEAVALESEVDKRRLHAGKYLRDAALVDIADDAAIVFTLDEHFGELVVLENGDTGLVAIRGNDHLFVH